LPGVILAGRDQRREDGPLFVGQVGGIRMSIHPAKMVANAWQNDAFRIGRRAIKLLDSLLLIRLG
jgi:hypothetical protein